MLLSKHIPPKPWFRVCILVLGAMISLQVSGQQDTSSTRIVKSVLLDSLVISGVEPEFDADDFIRMVREDTSFYKAFKNLRCFRNVSSSKILVYNRGEEQKASMERVARQTVENRRMWITINNETTNGKFYTRKGEHRYYTAELFDHIFFPRDTSTVSNIINDGQEEVNQSTNEKHKDQLKILMFNPGAEVDGVPLVGKKMAIFDPDMQPYYNYEIYSFDYQDSIPCYVFSCEAKKDEPEGKTVLKNLTSWFDKETMRIVSREYHLKYSSMLFDFNVKIYTDLTEVDGNLVPTHIRYSGFWDVPMKKPEIIDFKVDYGEFRWGL